MIDEDIILDWITSNPSTVSEAKGRGVPEDWRFFLDKSKPQTGFEGLQYLGHTPALRYTYVAPATSNSSDYVEFLSNSDIIGGDIEGPGPDILFSEFRPPTAKDLIEHVKGYGTKRQVRVRETDPVLEELCGQLGRIESAGPVIAGWLDPSHLAKVPVPAATSPGIRWKKLGYRTKKEALMMATVDAQRRLTRLLGTGQKYVVPPCGLAGRGKRVSTLETVENGGAPRKEGRMIVMPDLSRHLLGSMVSKPILHRIMGAEKKDGGILIGMGPFDGTYQSIKEWTDGADKFLFIDISKFDQSVPACVLKKAFDHIKTHVDRVPGEQAYWDSEYEQLVETEIALPDGRVFKKRRGVASGDPWTSIAGSYANWLMLSWACRLLGWRCKIWTFGDDSVIALYGCSEIKGALEKISRVLSEAFGIDVSRKKSYETSVLCGVNEDVEERDYGSFLSMYFLQTAHGVRPTRPLQDLHEFMMVPERNKFTTRWEIVRTSAAYLLFFWNDKARMVIEEYWDYLHRRHRVPSLTGTASDFELLRELDIPWSAFKLEWLDRLPTPGEATLLYANGHTGFFPPLLAGTVYSDVVAEIGGNSLLIDPAV